MKRSTVPAVAAGRKAAVLRIHLVRGLFVGVILVSCCSVAFAHTSSYVPTIVDLKKLDTGPRFVDKTLLTVGGYHSENDGGGGTFIWLRDCIETPDDGLVFLPQGKNQAEAGRWKRLVTDSHINVKWFGARGQPLDTQTDRNTRKKHDDTNALQRAITTAVAKRKVLFIPAGVYLVSKTINIPAVPNLANTRQDNPHFFILRSNGARLIVNSQQVSSPSELLGIARPKGKEPLDAVLTNQSPTYWVIIEGLQIDANYRAHHAIHLNGVGGARSIIRHVDVRRAISHGFLLEACEQLSVQNCSSYWNGGDGFYFKGCNGAVATTLSAEQSLTEKTKPKELIDGQLRVGEGNGITVTNAPKHAGGMTVNTPIIQDNRGHGIEIKRTDPKVELSVVINGGWIEGNDGDGVHIHSNSTVVKGLEIQGKGTGLNWAVRVAKGFGCVVQDNYFQAGPGSDFTYARVWIDHPLGTIEEEEEDFKPNFHRRTGKKSAARFGPPTPFYDADFEEDGNNLIQNGSFRLPIPHGSGAAKTPENWSKEDPKNVKIVGEFVQSDEQARPDDKYSCRVDATTVYQVRQTVDVGLDKRYRLSGWLYVENGTADIAVVTSTARDPPCFDYRIGNLCLVTSLDTEKEKQQPNSEGGWIKRTMDFTAHGNQVYVLLVAHSDSVAYFDDIELVELKEVP